MARSSGDDGFCPEFDQPFADHGPGGCHDRVDGWTIAEAVLAHLDRRLPIAPVPILKDAVAAIMEEAEQVSKRLTETTAASSQLLPRSRYGVTAPMPMLARIQRLFLAGAE